ncbi:hypothetical protein OPQ81_011063 [Rhizoctonia solani]|nr:hypothetical protein OPQ81_011063 [Rhizoctonia solani]
MKKQLKARLAVKLPDHPRREPYPMADVHAAALYLLDDDVFDSKTKGDGRTWLEQERGQQSSAQQDQTLPQYTSHRHQSPSPSSSSSGCHESTCSSRLASPVGHRSRVHWKDRELPPQQSRGSSDSMQDLLERMGRLTIDDPEYRQTFNVVQACFLWVAATLRPPSLAPPPIATLAAPASDMPPHSMACFYCGKEGCRMASCPSLRDHMTAGLIKPDPSNPRFFVYKDNSRLYPYPIGRRVADVEA